MQWFELALAAVSVSAFSCANDPPSPVTASINHRDLDPHESSLTCETTTHGDYSFATFEAVDETEDHMLIVHAEIEMMKEDTIRFIERCHVQIYDGYNLFTSQCISLKRYDARERILDEGGCAVSVSEDMTLARIVCVHLDSTSSETNRLGYLSAPEDELTPAEFRLDLCAPN